MSVDIRVGVLALQGAFNEHIQLLKKAFLNTKHNETIWHTEEVRTPEQLAKCDALIIPGGESTTIAIQRKPVWGTCAGMILLAEAANRTKRGGQDLIGGLDIRVHRNFFGRQVESFETELYLDFLPADSLDGNRPFRGVFIRAPIVEKLLEPKPGIQDTEQSDPGTIVAPSRTAHDNMQVGVIDTRVQVLAFLPSGYVKIGESSLGSAETRDRIIAVMQGNIFATSFHPELTDDARIHSWWLNQVQNAVRGL